MPLTKHRWNTLYSLIHTYIRICPYGDFGAAGSQFKNSHNAICTLKRSMTHGDTVCSSQSARLPVCMYVHVCVCVCVNVTDPYLLPESAVHTLTCQKQQQQQKLIKKKTKWQTLPNSYFKTLTNNSNKNNECQKCLICMVSVYCESKSKPNYEMPEILLFFQSMRTLFYFILFY